MRKYINLHEAELADRPREVGTTYRYSAIPLTYREERNKAFDKLPGVAGMGYYVIGDEPGYIDLYMTNEDSGKRYDDEAVEFGFNSLEDAAKYVNVVMGKTPKEFKPRFGHNPLVVSDTEDIHYVQLDAAAMKNLKNLIEEENIQVIPYSLDDFIVRAPKSVFDKIKKKYNLLSTVNMTKRYDRYDLTELGDNHQPKGKTLPKTIQSKSATGVGYSVTDLLKYGHANRRDNYQNKYNNQDYWENDMNIYEQLNKINDTESLSEKYNVKNAKQLKKLQEAEELTVREKVMRVLDNMEKSKTIDSPAREVDAEADASSREYLRKREAAHKEVWNLINNLRVKYKYSLREIEDIINYELKHTVSNVEVN